MLAAIFLAMSAGVSAVTGQWRVAIPDGHEMWDADRKWPADSVHWAVEHALHVLQQDGYLFATVHTTDSIAQRVEISKGDRGSLGKLMLEGVKVFDPKTLVNELPIRQGQPLTSRTLEKMLSSILVHYANEGYHLTAATIQGLVPAKPPVMDVKIRILEQPRPRLTRMQVSGAIRTRPGVLYHIAGLRAGEPLMAYDPVGVRSRLEGSGLFVYVDSVDLHIDADSSLIMHVHAEEAPPGAFDLALGYERSGSGVGALVGSGHLSLRNMFGGARMVEIALHRLPGQISRINITAADPYVMGLPLSVGAEFRGLQQDSTFGKRDYRLELGYLLDPSTQLFGLISRELTRPGLSGLALQDGRQRIPVASATLVGAGLRIRQVDHRYNPTRGYVVEMVVESGFKNTDGQIVRADTVSEHRRLHLSRLTARARLYRPHGRRRILVTGGDIRLLHAKEFDETDLFRFGGASSLRGYDEDRFRSPVVTRILLEYRYVFDTPTYGFAFVDLGYVDARRTQDAYAGLYPGFGAGFQLNTQAGLISLTLAANAEDPAAVRAHIRLSLGL